MISFLLLVRIRGLRFGSLIRFPASTFYLPPFVGKAFAPCVITLGYWQLIASAGIRIARQVEWARAAELVSVGASAFGAAVLVAPGAVVLGQRLPGAAWIAG
jgi:hypothetical protein